ncbi:MAG: ASPIC/UnbV domain-containing protein, partial [Planctomycetales bacterium]|nr:ASPIC/UnbV domain-containing protein [Planctomycetales bacterium]
VEVHAGGMRQRRLVSPSRSYLSQCELPVTFGLGQADTIDKVIVHWPDGSEQTVDEGFVVDSEVRIEQTSSTAAAKTP